MVFAQLHQEQYDKEAALFLKAAFSRNHLREKKEDGAFWLPYKQDLDRILHSKAIRRYSDKTQVIYLVSNDHLTHRNIHVQLVSAFARKIASILKLNVDLVEAISLGHDVGHPPFGHEGESYLSEIAVANGLGVFSHAAQSCRLLREIEPLNLGLAVYDGFLCHDGGMRERLSRPAFAKQFTDHFAELEKRKKQSDIDLAPMSLEGCLVKMCDTVSYLGKDIEDAMVMGIIVRQDVPKTILGTSNNEILDAAALDLILNSYGQEYIAFSEEVFSALKTLRAFNFEKIYVHPKLKTESHKIKEAYSILYEKIEKDFTKKGKESHLWKHFLHSKSDRYLEETPTSQKTVDYLAGMTDSYFIQMLDLFVIPQKIEFSL